MRFCSWIFLLLVAPLCAVAQNDAPKFKAEHVVLIVWDGMRPDFVTPEYAPTLSQLAAKGVTFARNHAVFPTSTEVNGTALATGVYPNRSGVIANREYRPEIDPLKPIDIQDYLAARKGDQLSGGKYLKVPTVAEILHEAGFRTVVAGTKPVALLHDRADREAGAWHDSVTLFEGKTKPEKALASIAENVQPMPEKITWPNSAQDAWTTRALTESLWREGVPKFSVLWLSDPDFTQHKFGPGSPEALAAIKSVDGNLATVLRALEEKGVREKTDVFLVSDHGFSNVDEQPDVAGTLTASGIDAVRSFTAPPKAGQVLVVGNSGVVLFYVIGRGAAVTTRLVEFLQKASFSGVIGTREKMAGTFTLDELRLGTARGPDVVLAMRWKDQKVGSTPGVLFADRPKKTVKGSHASLSRFEVHNTLIAAGPDFREGFTTELPSGNVDVAPTILALLGVKPPQPMDGRVLDEAFRDGPMIKRTAPQQDRMEASRKLGARKWLQYLLRTRFADVTYFEEGNSAAK